MAGNERPTGVTVLAILDIIGGSLCVIGTVAFYLLVSTLESYLLRQVLGTVMMAIAAVGGIFGILYLVAAYGLWIGKGWAWWLTIILSILGLMGGLMYMIGGLPYGIIPIAIDILIIYYFTRPNVKAFFGKGVSVLPPPPSILPSSDKYSTIRCPNCGHNNPSNFNYCGKCGAPLTEEETKLY